MIPTRHYRVTMKIKLHTSPLRELEYSRDAVFIRETKSYFVFDNFKVQKDNVVSIKAL